MVKSLYSRSKLVILTGLAGLSFVDHHVGHLLEAGLHSLRIYRQRVGMFLKGGAQPWFRVGDEESILAFAELGLRYRPKVD